MKTYAIVFHILGFTGKYAEGNRWLRVPTPVSGANQELKRQRRMNYLRVDADTRPLLSTTSTGEGWEEEQKGEIMMELDQIGNFGAFEDEPESSLMDAFVIEQVQDSTDEEEEQPGGGTAATKST
ncbi:expressed unknown protein [Seminavis robusta]|uniref:Uncharacterized protein n=1 Tax=Seminavis robusta TaxID=568900 RepID=A0A9N8DST2_9STRA|nr:expressed unknown protein [Seminavis robusta]|eukprot:Sro325_g117880.1 n/a (125) ;mRNA; f:62162-62536